MPAGTRVSAWIDGVEYGYATTIIHDGESFFTLNVPGDDPTTANIEGGKAGDIGHFKIGRLDSDQTSIWNSGTNMRINLFATDGEMPFRFYLPFVSN